MASEATGKWSYRKTANGLVFISPTGKEAGPDGLVYALNHMVNENRSSAAKCTSRCVKMRADAAQAARGLGAYAAAKRIEGLEIPK